MERLGLFGVRKWGIMSEKRGHPLERVLAIYWDQFIQYTLFGVSLGIKDYTVLILTE